jgi:hypothetical protein
MVGVPNGASNRSKGAGQLMTSIILIAIAAGCASALMFASIVSGALISLLLVYLAPLPLMVAALGWGPFSASLAGVAASVGVGAMFGVPLCAVFAIAVAFPAWWLGHLALLGRPTGGSVSSGHGGLSVAPDLEWYPVGRILLWASSLAALITIAALLSLGLDAASITGALRGGLTRFIQVIGERDAGSTGDSESVLDALATMVPIAAASVTTATLTLNLWLAGKITAISGRLDRPWPDLKAAALPSKSLAALCIAIALCFTGGLVSIAAQIIAATLLIANAFIGFAVLHTLTLSLKGRAAWLGCTYAVALVFVWPVVVMSVLGIADAVFGIRRRYLKGRPPPLPAL